MSRRRRYSVRGIPMKKRQMRTEWLDRGIQSENGEFRDDVGGEVEEI